MSLVWSRKNAAQDLRGGLALGARSKPVSEPPRSYALGYRFVPVWP